MPSAVVMIPSASSLMSAFDLSDGARTLPTHMKSQSQPYRLVQGSPMGPPGEQFTSNEEAAALTLTYGS